MTATRTRIIIAATITALAGAISTPAQPPALPDGEGAAVVRRRCVGCHDLEQVTRWGCDERGWRASIQRMIALGATLPPAELETMVRYLVANFPERRRPAAVAIPGEVEVVITEWEVPTPGSHPHDPLAAADGSLWYTGQGANLLGRLDPTTGAIREYRLPVPDSGPHGLAEDAAGMIWFTANAKGYIGRLDPRTGALTQYPMPDPMARDPHTPVFDAKGTLWFTVQAANMIGRLEPRTGVVALRGVPTPRSRPYGIVVDTAGVPWFAEFGGSRIGRIDPATLEIREFRLPHPETRPRRIGVGDDGGIWYTDHARGRLGRLDPSSGTARDWPSPGGPDSRPYGLCSAGGAVWYSESGVSPNTLVRFDPRTERFQSWAIPSGGGVVRHMDAWDDGRLALACSGVDRVARVEVRRRQ